MMTMNDGTSSRIPDDETAIYFARFISINAIRRMVLVVTGLRKYHNWRSLAGWLAGCFCGSPIAAAAYSIREHTQQQQQLSHNHLDVYYEVHRYFTTTSRARPPQLIL